MCYKTAKFKHHKLTWDPSTFNALSSAVFTLAFKSKNYGKRCLILGVPPTIAFDQCARLFALAPRLYQQRGYCHLFSYSTKPWERSHQRLSN